MNEKTEKLLAKLNKDFGKKSVSSLKDNPIEIKAIPTGSKRLDMALGIGGIPIGRIVEIYGPESSGKTTLTLHIIAEAQRMGLQCAIIDAEHALDPGYAENVGVDTDNLIINQPMYGEEGLQVAVEMIESGEFGLIVIDSVAALTPKKEIEGEMGDSTIGLQARMMGQALRKITAIAEVHDCCVIFINQLREKIGVMFGSPETTSGGNALKFYASVRIDVRKSLDIEHEANTTTFKVVKNKVAPPFRKAKLDVVWGRGFYREKELLELAVEMGLVEKGGSWYTINEEKIQGDLAVLTLLEDNPEFYKGIEEKVNQKIKDGYQSPREEPKAAKEK